MKHLSREQLHPRRFDVQNFAYSTDLANWKTGDQHPFHGAKGHVACVGKFPARTDPRMES